MKKYLPVGLLISLLSCYQLSFAQPSYTANSNPTIGQGWDVTMYGPANFSPGPAGANQSWDFSSLPVDMAWPPFQFEILDPVNAPFTDSFPGASHVLKWDLVGFPFHQYEYSDNQVRSALGGVVPEDSSYLSLTQYIDDDDALQYPLTFQKSYTFTSVQRVHVFGFTFDYFTEGKGTVDAYGTLKLASGTYNDVIRLVLERVEVDSTFFPPWRDTSYQYIWLQEGNGMPLLTYEYSLDPDGDDPTLYAASPTIANSLENQLAGREIQVNYHLTQPSISLIFEGFSPGDFFHVSLLDLQGRKLTSIFDGALPERLDIDLSAFPAGIYLIEAKDEKGDVITQKIIK